MTFTMLPEIQVRTPQGAFVNEPFVNFAAAENAVSASPQRGGPAVCEGVTHARGLSVID